MATLTGKVAHSAVANTGSFASANPLLGEIDEAAVRTILNNMHGFQTDTPTYEKNGWTGDAEASSGAAARSLGVARVWSKWLADYPDAQAPSGELPEIVPSTRVTSVAAKFLPNTAALRIADNVRTGASM